MREVGRRHLKIVEISNDQLFMFINGNPARFKGERDA